MALTATEITRGTQVEADLCVIGAGPAGIALAREFRGQRARVVVLESGGRQRDDGPQELNEGTVVGDGYALRRSRYRAVGGTVHLWDILVDGKPGAKYLPLDPHDFEQHPTLPYCRWPFDYGHLRPFYERAHVVCGLGPFLYEGQAWADEQRPCLRLGGSGCLSTKVYHFGGGHVFTSSYSRDLHTSENLSIYHHATVCRLETEGTGRRITAAKVVSRAGAEFRVRSRLFVLAAGAIENARLLLLSQGNGPAALGNHEGWVGRCFMEHLRDSALTFVPHSPELFDEAAFYDAHTARDGSVIGGRIAIDAQTIRAAGLPNASITLRPRFRARRSGILARWRRAAGRKPALSYGWSHVDSPASAFDTFQVLINIEQQPNPANRIGLGRERDRLGLPRVELHWRWRENEQAGLERLRALFAAELEATGLGRVEMRADEKPDPNAHHHAGTTRMDADPRWGVVDGDGRVHGTDNLYVTGGSVFPRAGFANPTLTIIALALRLADHLKQRM